MISPISFQGTYKVYSTKGDSVREYFYLTDECESRGIKTKIDYTDYTKKNQPQTADGKEINATATIVAPDDFDEYIETYCTSNNIRFTRLNQKELLEPRNIADRVVKPERSDKTATIAYINTKKLDEILATQTTNNFKHVEHDYRQYFKKDADFSLKSGENIVAPTIVLNSNMAGGIEGAIEYVDKYGASNLNKDSILINLNQMTDEPDHCNYFAMKDLGMEKIPVCVDRNSLELGQKLGLFE